MRSKAAAKKRAQNGHNPTLRDMCNVDNSVDKKSPSGNAGRGYNRKREIQHSQPSTTVGRKFTKLHVVKPSFNVIYADVLVKLSGAIYLLYGIDSDDELVIRVQDCVYNKQSSGDQSNFVARSVKLSV